MVNSMKSISSPVRSFIVVMLIAVTMCFQADVSANSYAEAPGITITNLYNQTVTGFEARCKVPGGIVAAGRSAENLLPSGETIQVNWPTNASTCDVYATIVDYDTIVMEGVIYGDGIIVEVHDMVVEFGGAYQIDYGSFTVVGDNSNPSPNPSPKTCASWNIFCKIFG